MAEKTVIDIRNITNNTLSGVYVEAYIPEGFTPNIEGKGYDEKLYLPDIKKNERVIVVINQEELALPGMGLSLASNRGTNVIKDELNQHGGSTHIVTINKDGCVSREIYSRMLQQNKLFWYKKYSKIIYLN